jgi:hypothetical protein
MIWRTNSLLLMIAICIFVQGCVAVQHTLDLGLLKKIEKESEVSKNAELWVNPRANSAIREMQLVYDFRNTPQAKTMPLDDQRTEIITGVDNTIYFGSAVKEAYETGVLEHNAFRALVAHEMSHIVHEDAISSLSSKKARKVGLSVPDVVEIGKEVFTVFLAHKVLIGGAGKGFSSAWRSALFGAYAYNSTVIIYNNLIDVNTDSRLYLPTSHGALHGSEKEQRADCETLKYLKKFGASGADLSNGLGWLKAARTKYLDELSNDRYADEKYGKSIVVLKNSVFEINQRLAKLREPIETCPQI